jgi:hypothetical protein
MGMSSSRKGSMWEGVHGDRVNVSGFGDWGFWLAAALRGFQGRHLPKPLLKHRRRKDSFMWKILDRYERLFAQIILNNHAAYSDEEVDIAEESKRPLHLGTEGYGKPVKCARLQPYVIRTQQIQWL